jgi:hypothetical protein
MDSGLRPSAESVLAGFINILSSYQIEVGDIRHVYKRTNLGALIHVDTDFVVGLAGSFFLMKVLVILIPYISNSLEKVKDLMR